MTNYGPRQDMDIFLKARRHCLDSGGAATMALRAACGGIVNTK